MDRRVGTYLHNTYLHNTPTNPNPQSLFIAETRDSYWLPLVIENAVREFPGWDLYVCAPPSVLTWLDRLPGIPKIHGIVLDIPTGRASVGVFNAIMYSPEIWKVFDTEYVLVFQCDTVMAPGAAKKLPSTKKDYYGAACGTLSETEFVVNGGLSYRRVDAFARACALLTDDDKTLPEDVAYSRILRTFGNFPSLRECCEFAIESVGNPAAVVGIHGTDKGYAPPALIASVLGHPAQKIVDIVDIMPYDGEPIFETRLRLLENVVDTFVLVQARFTHSGLPKEIIEPPAHPKIRHVIIDAFPPMPADFGFSQSWIRPEAREAWWREQYQRDYFVAPDDCIAVYSDVDEIPDPAVLCDLKLSDVGEIPVHLDMAFLVNSPLWQKREPWHKAFVCSGGVNTPTAIRNSQPRGLIRNAGWHCSSFFGVDRQIQKIQSFAHREFAAEIDPETIRARFESGKDPYGRGPEFDAVKTDAFVWLHFA